MNRMSYKIVDVSSANIDKYPQAICFINPKNEHFHHKVEWLKQEFKNGLKIKLLFADGIKRAVGFMEYTIGENCYRAVSAKGYTFIHCIWTNGKKFQKQGLGKALLDEVAKDEKGSFGICTVASKKAFMANDSIFIKNGFKQVKKSASEQLLVKVFKADAPLPYFLPLSKAPAKGLCFTYSLQCPWVGRFAAEAKEFCKTFSLKAKFVLMKDASQAQRAGSIYSCLTLSYNGKILADRYISLTRFKNILKKEKIWESK